MKPRAPAFRLTKAALNDLVSIGSYTQTESGAEQTRRYLSQLDDAFSLLAKTPQRGQRCDEIRAGYFRYHVGKHITFFKMREKGVDIIRILHERMLADLHFNEEE